MKYTNLSNNEEFVFHLMQNERFFVFIVKELGENEDFDFKSHSKKEIKEFIENHTDEIILMFQLKNLDFLVSLEAEKKNIIEYFVNKHCE